MPKSYLRLHGPVTSTAEGLPRGTYLALVSSPVWFPLFVLYCYLFVRYERKSEREKLERRREREDWELYL